MATLERGLEGMPHRDKEQRAAYKKVYNKAYREANKDKIKAYFEAYYEANKDKIKAYYEANKEANTGKKAARMKAYYEANKEKYCAIQKAYRQANKEKHNAHVSKHRALKRQAILPTTDNELIRNLYKRRVVMTKENGEQYHVDHIIPLSIGGAHHQDNIRIISAKENQEKSNKYIPELGGVWADNALARETKKKLKIK